MEAKQPEALDIAKRLEFHSAMAEGQNSLTYIAVEAAKELRRLHDANVELSDMLKSAGLLLHHFWCDVQMNDYSFEKLSQQMAVVDAAIAKAAAQKQNGGM